MKQFATLHETTAHVTSIVTHLCATLFRRWLLEQTSSSICLTTSFSIPYLFDCKLRFIHFCHNFVRLIFFSLPYRNV